MNNFLSEIILYIYIYIYSFKELFAPFNKINWKINQIKTHFISK